MERTEFLQVVTLWFVVLLLLQHDASNIPFDMAIGFVAVAILYLAPVYLVVEIVADLREE